MTKSWIAQFGLRSGKAFAAAVCAVVIAAQVFTAGASALGETLDRRIPALMARHDVAGLNVLVLRNGRETWSGSFGMADPKAGIPMTRDRVFRVESISKPVSAWGVLRLVEKSEVALDDVAWDHVTSWVPPEGTPRMTIRQLLSGTAGLGIGDFTARYPPDGQLPNLREVMRDDFDVVGQPGAGFAYSNVGFNVLEILIEDVIGLSFAEYMAADVLRPLGAGGASFDWTPALAARMPIGHGLGGERIAAHVYPGRAAGGLLADIGDISRFVRAGMDAPHGDAGTVLSGQAIKLMHREEVAMRGMFAVVSDGYGLGHFTETLSDGRRAVWHGGQGHGWMSHFHLVPETGDAIILLANSQRAWPLFGEVLREWSASLGVAPVGMARVALVWWIGLGLTAALAFGAAVQALRLGLKIGGQRRLRRPSALRGLAAFVGGGMIAAVLWAAGQDYLFLYSVLPGLTGWLAAAATALGLVMVVSAFWAPGSRC